MESDKRSTLIFIGSSDHDIANEHPEIVQKMIEIAQKEHTNSELFPVTMPSLDKR